MSHAPHKIPPVVVKLGTVLDLTTQEGRLRTLWEASDVGGLVMCCTPDAMRRSAGRAALYLLRIDRSTSDRAQHIVDEARDTYTAWHKRPPIKITDADKLPASISVEIGRALRIGYRSDKWEARGKTNDYDHDYTEPGYRAPKVWADAADLAKARAIVIVGGNQRITAQGID